MTSWVIKILIFTTVLTLSLAVSARSQAGETKLSRANVSNIKIIGSEENNIHFFLKGTDKKTYRFSNMNERDASHILKRLKDKDPIIINTRMVEDKAYLDVVDWK